MGTSSAKKPVCVHFCFFSQFHAFLNWKERSIIASQQQLGIGNVRRVKVSEGEDVGKMNCYDWHWYDKIHHPVCSLFQFQRILHHIVSCVYMGDRKNNKNGHMHTGPGQDKIVVTRSSSFFSFGLRLVILFICINICGCLRYVCNVFIGTCCVKQKCNISGGFLIFTLSS